MTREQALNRRDDIVATLARMAHDREQLEAEAKDLRRIVLAELLPPERTNKHPIQKRSSNSQHGATQEVVLRTLRENGKEMSPREIADYANVTIQAVYAAAGTLAKKKMVHKNRDGVLTTYELAVHADNHTAH